MWWTRRRTSFVRSCAFLLLSAWNCMLASHVHSREMLKTISLINPCWSVACYQRTHIIIISPREHHIVCRLAYTPRIAWTVHVTRPIILSGPIHYTSFLSKKKIVHIQVVWCFAPLDGKRMKTVRVTSSRGRVAARPCNKRRTHRAPHHHSFWTVSR
jgi:hypothetical protein